MKEEGAELGVIRVGLRLATASKVRALSAWLATADGLALVPLDQASVILTDAVDGRAPSRPTLLLVPATRPAGSVTGFAGVLSEATPKAVLAAAITAIARGLTVSQGTVRETAHRPAATDDVPIGDPRSETSDVVLTQRETEVLALLAEGLSNKAIARRLGISTHTAKFHVAAVVEKLDAHGRTDAVAHAVRLGVLML